ncbi:MAG TPA: hypothetical protein VF507_01940 [Pyrinomonadaceae bacterium]
MSAAAINIGPQQQRRRWVTGLIALAFALALAALLVYFHAPRWSRLFVFLPAIIAGLGFFQAREKT